MERLLDRIDGPEDLKRLPPEALPGLAAEIRQEILETVAANGGHLGGPLGAVEIAIALHYVFDSPQDKMVWDVSHQAYAHKLLTGRRARFRSLRKRGGIAGFCRRDESPHDPFGTGHASTSISAALGILEGKRLKGETGKVIAVIGDGGLSGGLAFEALNQAGPLERDLIVVLNANDMSIGRSVGSVSLWLSRKLTSERLNKWRRRIKGSLRAWAPEGERVIAWVQQVLESSKALLTPGILFEGLGFEYVGPVPGHDLEELIATFRLIKQVERPILVHATTVKGKGYGPAERDDEAAHGIGPFDIRTGEPLRNGPPVPTWTEVFGRTIVELGAGDPRIVAITAAMRSGTGLSRFAARFPARFYDVGIAEAHAVCFAAGLAAEGLRPVCAIYSTFLQRAYDQLVHDVALQNLPVVLALDRAGLVGEDGPTHHGAFDLSYLRTIPGFVVMAPKDEDELRHMLATALECRRPAAIRYPRGAAFGVPLEGAPRPLEVGRGEILFEGGRDVALIAIGARAHAAVEAARQLAAEGVGATVVNARFVKPLDESLLADVAAACGRIVTVEENALRGGFGEGVLEALQRAGLSGLPMRRLGLPDGFAEQGGLRELLALYGLDAEGIACAARSLVERPAVAAEGARPV